MILFSRVWSWMRMLLGIVGSLAKLIAWYLPPTIALYYWTPRVTVPLTIITVACAVYWYTQRKARTAAEEARRLPLQSLGSSVLWVAGVALLEPLVEFGASIVSELCGYPLDKVPNPVTPFLHQPGGLLAFGTVAVLAAPVLEEFAFRGWIQTPLERRLGAPWAIVITALLFAAMHLEPLRIPFLFFGGVVLGLAVYLTRSIWAGVAIHFGNNLLAMLGVVPRVAVVLDQTGPARWWKVLPFLLLTTVAFVFLLRGLWRATRSTRSSPLIAQSDDPLVPAELVP